MSERLLDKIRMGENIERKEVITILTKPSSFLSKKNSLPTIEDKDQDLGIGNKINGTLLAFNKDLNQTQLEYPFQNLHPIIVKSPSAHDFNLNKHPLDAKMTDKTSALNRKKSQGNKIHKLQSIVRVELTSDTIPNDFNLKFQGFQTAQPESRHP